MASPPLTPSLGAGGSSGRRKPSTNKEAGVLGIEDVASYSDFFSPEEWHAIHTGDWSHVPDEDRDDPTSTKQVSSGVAVNGPDCAAQRDQAAPEDSSAARAKRHSVSVFVPGMSGNRKHGYVLECIYCGFFGEADTLEEAHATARLHEEFVAVLVDRWDVS
jgi:hypothetical protein